MSNVLGHGVDIVHILRLEKYPKDKLQSLAKRVLDELELQEFRQSTVPHRFLAKRFAAKEAVLKSLGCGLWQIPFRDIRIAHKDSGEPQVVLFGRALEIAQEKSVQKCIISISDEKEYCFASAIAVSSNY